VRSMAGSVHRGRPFNPSPSAQAGIFNGEVEQLQSRLVIWKN
jgi:hypothetical protein